MLVSELIAELEKAKAEYGDLKVTYSGITPEDTIDAVKAYDANGAYPVKPENAVEIHLH